MKVAVIYVIHACGPKLCLIHKERSSCLMRGVVPMFISKFMCYLIFIRAPIRFGMY